ncbi:MAG: hypothetical protein MUC95_10080 [Spirochaetes bacterium]|nr:hypothetical protein [Spirochaetota bacterium]
MTVRIIRTVWTFLGDLRLSFYLLIGAALFFLIGAVYTGSNYKFFHGLNEIRLQDWMLENFALHLSITWWMPVLFLMLAILGLNTFICSVNRITELCRAGLGAGLRKFFHSMTPLLIHLLFIMIMAGHGITFVFGSWDRSPVKEGEAVNVKNMPELRAASIEDLYFPKNTALKKRIRETEVKLRSGDGKEIEVSFLNHVKYGDYYLHLELVRNDSWRDLKKPGKRIGGTIDEDTCNKAPIYHIAKPVEKDKERELIIVAIKDPGLPLVIFGFTAILILMVWYYAGNSRKKEARSE